MNKGYGTFLFTKTFPEGLKDVNGVIGNKSIVDI